MGVWRDSDASSQWSENPHSGRWIRPVGLAVAVVVVVALLAIGGLTALVRGYYGERFYPGVNIEGYDVGGLTRAEIAPVLADEIERRRARALDLVVRDPHFGETTAHYTQADLGVEYNLEAALDSAFHPGHTGNFIADAATLVYGRSFGYDVTIPVHIDRARVEQKIADVAARYDLAPRDGNVAIAADHVVVTPPIPGKRLDIGASAQLIERQLPLAENGRIELVAEQVRPAIDNPAVARAYETASSYLIGPLDLSADEVQARFERADIARSLSVTRVANPEPGLSVRFDNRELTKFIGDLKPQIDRERKSAGLKVERGAVVVTSPSVVGREMNVDATVAKAMEALTKADRTVPIVVNYIQPRISQDQVAQWVKVGSASTVYESARDRMYNIELAVERLDGTVVDPGESFSLNPALGSTGYRTAFVIVDERTQPGVGGGLCQVATTLFQAVFWGGYQVTERAEHSYWIPRYTAISPGGVRYAGLDSAIFEPEPDLKFVNNGEGHLYIHMRADGNRLYVDLFGPPPGWKVDIANYWVGNHRPSAGKVVHVSEPSLRPGETVLVEEAREGFEASVTRVVTRDGQEVDRKVFRSFYQPTNTTYLHGPGAMPANQETSQ
jgi:vancomycin resistance protein YoaR